MAGQPEGSRRRDAAPRDPVFVQNLLSDVRFAPLWLVLRVVLGWLWLEAGRLRLHTHVGVTGMAGLDDPLAIGLMLSGIALILGFLTGPAAFVGGFLSSGPAAVGAVLPATVVFTAVVWLALVWKTAGWIGIDRWLLPMLGMPWRGGNLFGSWTGIDRGRRSGRQS